MAYFKQTKVIAFTNHKGGAGKTTSVVNLACAFGRLEYKVLVVDLDPQGNASEHIGKIHPSRVDLSCAQLLMASGTDKLAQAIQSETHLHNVSLISGSLALLRAEDDLKDQTPRPSEELRAKLESADGVFDIILIDCPPSLKLLTSNAMACATHIIVPIESGSQYGLYGADDLIKHIDKIKRINPGLELLGALLVKHDERTTVCRLLEKTAADAFGKILPEKISTSTKVLQAVIMQQSVHGLDRAAKPAREYTRLAAKLVDMIDLKKNSAPQPLEHDNA